VVHFSQRQAGPAAPLAGAYAAWLRRICYAPAFARRSSPRPGPRLEVTEASNRVSRLTWPAALISGLVPDSGGTSPARNSTCRRASPDRPAKPSANMPANPRPPRGAGAVSGYAGTAQRAVEASCTGCGKTWKRPALRPVRMSSCGAATRLPGRRCNNWLSAPASAPACLPPPRARRSGPAGQHSGQTLIFFWQKAWQPRAHALP